MSLADNRCRSLITQLPFVRRFVSAISFANQFPSRARTKVPTMSTPPELKPMPRSAGLRPGAVAGSGRFTPEQGPALARPVVPSPVRPTTASHPVAPHPARRMASDSPVFVHPAGRMPSDGTVCLTFLHQMPKNRTECPTFPGQMPSDSPEYPVFPTRNRPFRPDFSVLFNTTCKIRAI